MTTLYLHLLNQIPLPRIECELMEEGIFAFCFHVCVCSLFFSLLCFFFSFAFFSLFLHLFLINHLCLCQKLRPGGAVRVF